MDKINQLLNCDSWAITDCAYNQLRTVIVNEFRSGSLLNLEKHLEQRTIVCYSKQPYTADRWELTDDKLPENSIAVIELEGILYSWDTIRFERYIRDAIANDRISGIVLWINGPGGMISNVDVVEQLIATSSKPIAAYVSGMAASAHYWIASGCRKMFLASKLTEVGSVGIFTTYISFNKYYKKEGIDYRDIYPDSCDLKNKLQREITDNNNEEPLKEKLSFIHKIFCNTVAKNRNIKYDPALPVFRGEMFLADDAIKNKYADQYGTLDDAVAWVLAQSAISRSKDLFDY